MTDPFLAHLSAELQAIEADGLLKRERLITTPQSAHIRIKDPRAQGGEREMLNLCANNYLGLADHPEVIEAARAALDEFGFGMASVRFICGAQTLHRQLEERIARWLGKDDAILFAACFDANGGVFEPLLVGRGRDHLRRAEPRLDHRRHPAVQGEALPLRQFRHGRARRRS